MKTIYLAAAAALLMASTAAHAGSAIAFNVGGHNIRVSAPRHCQSLSCLQISGIDLNALKSGKNNDDDDAPASTATSTPVMPSAPAAAAPAPQTSMQPTAAIAAPAPVASVTAALTPPAPVAAPVPAAPTAKNLAAAPIAPPAPVAQPVPVAPAADPNSPLGLWATEENKGNVRIEQCGDNLCGYAEKSGEKVLINMRPKDSKWVGRIHDPDGGGNYDSTIALKGSNTLRVQGCAFGGLFCGGQTWKRVS
jgi:uncharacterized protein (DUF2147 family)